MYIIIADDFVSSFLDNDIDIDTIDSNRNYTLRQSCRSTVFATFHNTCLPKGKLKLGSTFSFFS